MSRAILILAMIGAVAVEAAAADAISDVERTRRSHVLLSALANLPPMGDDTKTDAYSDSIELRLDMDVMVPWDDAAFLGRHALISLEADLLSAAEPAIASPSPTPGGSQTVPPPAPPIAYSQIMGTQPYCAGPIPVSSTADPETIRLASALVNAGEQFLTDNSVAVLMTAAADREPTLLADILPELQSRDGQLLLALGGGYQVPGIPLITEPFDQAQATWCLTNRSPIAANLFDTYLNFFTQYKQSILNQSAVETAWKGVVQSYSTIFIHGDVPAMTWHEVSSVIVLPDLYQILLTTATNLRQSIPVAQQVLPSCGVLGGVVANKAFQHWVLIGGAGPQSNTEMAKIAGQLSDDRLRLIGALWLFDRLLDDLDDVPLTPSLKAAKTLAHQLDPLRTLSVGLPGYGVTDDGIAEIVRLIVGIQAQALTDRAAVLNVLSRWNQGVDADPSIDGWALTALRTRRYCVAVATLAVALAHESSAHAIYDFKRMQLDIAAVLTTTLRQQVVVGSPLLCEYLRATRIGVYLVANSLSGTSAYQAGVIPDAYSRNLYLPPRHLDESLSDYWARVCRDIIFPSFEGNALDQSVTAAARAMIRIRADATRKASLALDRLGLCAWTIRKLASEQIHTVAK